MKQNCLHIRQVLRQFRHLFLPLVFVFACKQTSSSQELNAFQRKIPLKDYTIFDNEIELAKWYESYRPTLSTIEAADMGEILKVSAEKDRYTELNKMVAILWKPYQEMFPDRVQGVPPPRVLILKNQRKAASVTYDRIKNLLPNVIFIYSGIIEANFMNREAVLGVIAHELAHHVLQHLVPGVSAKVTKYYMVTSKEPLGVHEPQNLNVKAQAESWIEAAQMVGTYRIPVLQGIPVPSFGTPFLKIIAQKLSEKYPDREACRKMTTAINAAEEVVSKKLDGATGEMGDISSIETVILKAAGQSYNNELALCLAGETTSIVDFLAKSQHRSIQDVLRDTHLNDKELAAIKQQGNTSQALIEFANLMSERLEKLNKGNNIGKFRIYSTEEQADDTAIEVLRKLNLSARPLIEFLESHMSEEQLKNCNLVVKSGRVPAYGSLLDRHHGTCFRIYHAYQVEGYLKRKNLSKLNEAG